VVNARLRVTGHLFQSRFGSVAMDEDHLMTAARYVALNPVRARLVERPEDWRGQAFGRISKGGATGSSTSGRFSIARRAASPISSTKSPRPTGSPLSARPKGSADRSVRRRSSIG
jgi:hypothetical protein